MVGYQEGIEKGIEIANKTGRDFYRKNAIAYNRLGFEEHDVISYLLEEVLCRAYIPMLEKNPNFYKNLTSFQSSFWTACHRRLLVHSVFHFKSQKRGDYIRSGIIELDNEVNYSHSRGTYYRVQLAVDSTTSYLSRIKILIDQCENSEVWKALALLAYGKVSCKSELSRILGYSREKFRRLWILLVQYVKDVFEQNKWNGPHLVYASSSTHL